MPHPSLERPGREKPSGETAATADLPRLTAAEFSAICGFARERFGLDLKAGKEELVAARLAKKMRRGGFSSYRDYFEAALGDASGRALTELIDALTTNHTSFYREPAHFDLLARVARSEFESTPVLRVWSAACSSGEEPYTIAACLCGGCSRPPSRFEIRATDISSRVLETARRGVYPANAVEALPLEWRRAAFLRGEGRSQGWYRVRPDVMARIRFEPINLIETPAGSSRWHCVFCRNVMIYFDKPTQERVVNWLAGALEPGGYLFVGHSESLAGIHHPLSYAGPATYRLDGAAKARRSC